MSTNSTNLQGPSPESSEAPAGPAVAAICVECKTVFRMEDVIVLGGLHCCSNCKPIVLQKLGEGCASAPPQLPAGTELLRVSYRSTRAANWRCNIYALFHNKHSALVFIPSILLLSFVLPLPTLASNPILNLLLRAVAVGVGLGLLNLVLLAVSILRRLPTARTVRTCTSALTSEGISDVTPEKRRVVRWHRITQIREHKGDIHVWFGASGIFIPREAFKDLEEARSFAGLAVELRRSARGG